MSQGEVSALEHAVNGVPVLDTPTEGFDSAAPAADRRPRGDRPRHRRPPRWQTISNREISLDRRARLRLLAGSLIGAGCLVLAYRLQPGDASPFAAPSGAVAWIALIAGIAGIWLVPGLWLSAVMMRTGIGPTARLATRIGTTLTWYALVGPVIHVSAEGAFVTPGGIVGATVAATAAVCLGSCARTGAPPSESRATAPLGRLGRRDLCADSDLAVDAVLHRWRELRPDPPPGLVDRARLCVSQRRWRRQPSRPARWCERLGTSGRS